MEPYVKILYSESEDRKLQSGCVMSLGIANTLLEQRDFLCAERRDIESLVYEIYYTVDAETRTYCCSQNLGDGQGSVINHLRKETVESLETLNTVPVQENTLSSKSPFNILRNVCENMLQVILPELEAYCLAYRAFDIILSYRIDNCHPRMRESLDSLIFLIKNETTLFVEMLNDIIINNPDDTSLIFSVEVLIDKTERYMEFVLQKDGEKDRIVDILREASQRATVINSKSIFYEAEPPTEENCFDNIPYV